MKSVDIKSFCSEVDSIVDIARDLIKSKSNDYSDSSNVFNNLSLCERLNITSTEKGILVRLLDKVGRLSNLLNTKATPRHESVLDSVMDLICYGIILYIYLNHKPYDEDEDFIYESKS